MPAYKIPRPCFDRLSTQEYIKLFLSNNNDLNTYQVLSAIKVNSPLDFAIQAFREHTNVPLQIPLMGFLHLVGAWLMKQNSTISIKGAVLNPDLWTVVLAPSGAGKTFAVSQLQKASSKALDIKAEFDSVASASAFFEELRDKNGSMWFADEFAQFLGQVEQAGSPLSQCKEYLLKTYDGNPIQRKTKVELIEIEKPVLNILGVNTLESYLNKISEESFTDGFSQRFAYLIAKTDPTRPFKNYTWFDDDAIQISLTTAFSTLSNLSIHSEYIVSAEAFIAYESGFQFLLKHDISESFYRRLMFRSFKYAMIYHVIHGNESNEITPDDIGWAMRLIALHIADLKELLTHYNYSELAKTIKKVQDKKADFALKCKPFGVREVVQNIKQIKTVNEAKIILDFVEKLQR